MVECTNQATVVITCLAAVMYAFYPFSTEIILTIVFFVTRIIYSAFQWQVGSSSYSSMYSSHGMGSSNYMGTGSSGSYY